VSKDGKTLFGTGEYTGKMSKTDIATGKTEVIDWGPSPSAPDYLDAGKDGKYVFAGNYYHSTVGVFSTSPFKLVKEIPVGKNPHGTDVIPEGTMVLVSDKLSATMTIIDAREADREEGAADLRRTAALGDGRVQQGAGDRIKRGHRQGRRA
jgi:DNA-binding beta-propeller fold protein YncE